VTVCQYRTECDGYIDDLYHPSLRQHQTLSDSAQRRTIAPVRGILLFV
jgi:hypothetical protein